MSHTCCRTWCGRSRAVTPRLSSCGYHDIVIAIGFQSITKKSISARCGPHYLHTANHWYSWVVIQESRTSPQKPALKWCCDVRVVLSGVTFVRRKWDGVSIWLSGGFVGSSSALLSRSSDASGSVVSWTASVECACGHSAVSPTSSAFYSSGSGPLGDSDFAIFFSFIGRLARSLSLSLSRPTLAGTPCSHFSGPHQGCTNP